MSRHAYYLGDGIWAPRQFSRDDGFFNGRGGGVSVANGGAIFDYDRDYPYDFPSHWDGEREAPYGDAGLSPEPNCTDQPVRDRRSGERVFVRICR